MVSQAPIRQLMCRTIGEKPEIGPELGKRKLLRVHLSVLLLQGKKFDDGLAGVGPSRAPDFVEIGVQHLLEALTAGPDSGMMELDFKCLENSEELIHR